MTALSFEDFQLHAGSLFTLRDEAFPPLELELEQADRLAVQSGPKGSRPPFSLIFRCADERVLPQKIYQLAHASMGELIIFLVPIGKDARGVQYEAVFN